MARLGHSSPRAALIYQHATEQRDHQIARGIDDLLAAAGTLVRADIPPTGEAVIAIRPSDGSSDSLPSIGESSDGQRAGTGPVTIQIPE